MRHSGAPATSIHDWSVFSALADPSREVLVVSSRPSRLTKLLVARACRHRVGGRRPAAEVETMGGETSNERARGDRAGEQGDRCNDDHPVAQAATASRAMRLRIDFVASEANFRLQPLLFAVRARTHDAALCRRVGRARKRFGSRRLAIGCRRRKVERRWRSLWRCGLASPYHLVERNGRIRARAPRVSTLVLGHVDVPLWRVGGGSLGHFGSQNVRCGIEPTRVFDVGAALERALLRVAIALRIRLRSLPFACGTLEIGDQVVRCILGFFSHGFDGLERAFDGARVRETFAWILGDARKDAREF